MINMPKTMVYIYISLLTTFLVPFQALPLSTVAPDQIRKVACRTENSVLSKYGLKLIVQLN
jgi:hypothetical protein